MAEGSRQERGERMSETSLATAGPLTSADGGIDTFAVARLLASRWKLLVFGPLAVGLLALGVAFLIPPTFTASTIILPPSQSSSSLAALAGQLGGALGGLAGAASGIKNPGDQYVALLKSRNVADRIVDRYHLREIYDAEFDEDARKQLWSRIRIIAGAKDGLITIEVDDGSPDRAAEVANAFVDELRRMTREFAVGEASQRRAFFEEQVRHVRESLSAAERALGSSGITDEALKATPAAALERLARVKAQIAAQEVKLASMRGFVAADNPDFRQAETEMLALRAQLKEIQRSSEDGVDEMSSGYAEKYRNVKYNQILFELVVQQYEVARLDEAREGNLIQVIDRAEPPKRKTGPKKALIGLVCALFSSVVFISLVVLKEASKTT
jgi:uncharacterized protein involved in exopolysaccharide biosynthesis/uncharacterized coiled-coil protein SlyX